MSWFTINVNTQMAERQFSLLQQTLERMEKTMALNFDVLNAGLASLEEDYGIIADAFEVLKNNQKPDTSAEDQAKIDAAVTVIQGLDAKFDNLVSVTSPAPEAPVEEPAPTPEA